MAGEGGQAIDMARRGAVSSALLTMTKGRRASLGKAARHRAESVFDRRAVAGEYMAYYERIMAAEDGLRREAHGKGRKK